MVVDLSEHACNVIATQIQVPAYGYVVTRVVWCINGVSRDDPQGDITNLGKEQQSEWAPFRRGSWSDTLGFPMRQITTSFVMYALSRFHSIEQRPKLVVMLNGVSPSDCSIVSNEW
jgi:hypothetical protein